LQNSSWFPPIEPIEPPEECPPGTTGTPPDCIPLPRFGGPSGNGDEGDTGGGDEGDEGDEGEGDNQ